MEKQFNDELFRKASVPRTIMKFAIPTVLSQLVTLLYNLADTFFVGHTNNPAQVAALTLSFPIFMMMTMIGNLFGIGGNSFISRSLGAGDREKAKKASTFAFYGALAMMFLVMIILELFMEPILRAIGAKTDEVLHATSGYLRWTMIFGGLPTVGTLMLGHLIRSEGNTRQASIGMALGGILNIGLDPIFVQGLGMGAPGAGLATCISNVIGFCYLLRIALRTKNTIIVLNPLKLHINSEIAKGVILVGIPSSAIIILGSSANVILTHFMSNYGEVSVAAFGVVQKVTSITIQITIGLTQGIMPLLGYNYGAGDMARVKTINNWSFGILAVYTVSCIALVELLPKQIMLLFISEEETVATGIEFMRRWILCGAGMCFTSLFNTIFQAMGNWFASLMLSILRQGVLLIPLLIILDNFFGKYGLIWSQPISDTCSLLIGIIIYAIVLKKQKKKNIVMRSLDTETAETI